MNNKKFWAWTLFGYFTSSSRAKLEYEQHRKIQYERERLAELARLLQDEGS